MCSLLLIGAMVSCGLSSPDEPVPDARQLLVIPAGVRIPGAYSTRRRYLGRHPVDKPENNGRPAREFEADQVIDCEYIVDLPGLAEAFAGAVPVTSFKAFDGVSLRVLVDGSGLASIDPINVPVDLEGAILTQRKIDEVTLLAITMATEDPVEALIGGTATKPEPGSLAVRFGGFLDETNARWMQLSLHDSDDGSVLMYIHADGSLEFLALRPTYQPRKGT